MQNRTTGNRYELNFDKTIPCFIDNVGCGNSLSEKVVETVDFHKGVFFTLLSAGAELGRIYEFERMGILPSKHSRVPNPEGSGSWQVVTNTNRELGEFVWNYCRRQSPIVVVIEDFHMSPSSRNVAFQNVKMIPFNEEVYHVVNHSNTLAEATKVISKCKLVWHFLLVGSLGSRFLENNLDEISANADLVVCSAYDGEGFILWERS